MKIVRIKGGLGNQLFQYTFAKIIEQIAKEEVRLDFSSYKTLVNDPVRKPRLLKFNTTLQVATQEEIDSVCLLPHRTNSLSTVYKIGIFAENLLNRTYFFEKNREYLNPEQLKKYNFYDGYWQSWRYYAQISEIIKKDLTPNYCLDEKTVLTQKQMSRENSVFVGVRRGDYSKESRHYGTFTPAYYHKCMEYISQRVEDPVFYVFSNDIDWCKDCLSVQDFNIHFRELEDQVDDFEELMLMNSCKHAIIINSTYHWWGATLIDNSSKIVCCPEHWFFDVDNIDIYPNGWVRIRGE